MKGACRQSMTNEEAVHVLMYGFKTEERTWKRQCRLMERDRVMSENFIQTEKDKMIVSPFMFQPSLFPEYETTTIPAGKVQQ